MSVPYLEETRDLPFMAWMHHPPWKLDPRMNRNDPRITRIHLARAPPPPPSLPKPPRARFFATLRGSLGAVR